MKKAVAEIESSVVPFENQLPLAKADLESLAERRKLLAQFVQSQLREDIDFGVIEGCKKPSLFKPGAEKIAQLFGLGVRMKDAHRTVDLHQNFAMFSYLAEVYHLRTGTVVAQLEGSCNSHEKKYRHRRVEGVLQETQVGDVLNTISKMAQKRAYVGAIIQATGASDFYTQDIDDPDDADQAGIKKPPKKAAGSMPKATAARSVSQDQAPVCCERPMMVSKFHADTWYCVNCKATKPF